MSNVITSQQWGPPAVGTRDGNWVWNGSNWICNPDCGSDGQPCPPFGPPVFSGPVNQPPWYPGANGGVSFGATAPPNPVRGHMWWDGTSFWLFDGAAWVPIGGQATSGGAATGTTPPSAPFTGQQWFNGSTLFIWDGNAWVPTSTTKSYIQPTAPPSPNPGDTWFDNTQMRIWTGTAWALVGPGAFVGPVGTTSKVFEVATNTQTTALAGPGVYDIAPINGTPTINTGGAWDAVNFKYTPSVAGVYNFEVTGWNQGGTGNNLMALLLALNDTGSPLNVAATPLVLINETTSQSWISSSGMVKMNGVSDFVRVWVYVSQASIPWISFPSIPNIRAFLMP
jgi:hypothetical protein